MSIVSSGSKAALKRAPCLPQACAPRSYRLARLGLIVFALFVFVCEVGKDNSLPVCTSGICTAEAAGQFPGKNCCMRLRGVTSEGEKESPLLTEQEEDERMLQKKHLDSLLGLNGPQDMNCNLMCSSSLGQRREHLRTVAKKLTRWHASRNRGPHKNTKLILFLRHAESTANKELQSFWGLAGYAWSKIRGKNWGDADPPLSETGRQQCAEAAAELRYLLMLLDSFQQDQQLSLKSPEASEEVNASAGEGTEWSQAPETATETATTTAVAEQETAAVTNSFCFDAFLVSPLTRALQTASLSFHDVGSALKCPEVITEQPQPQQQHHHREHRHHQVTWLVEPLLREKFSNMTDSGTEAAELRQLLKLLCGRHEMFPALFNFALIPDGQKWWLPYLKKTLSTLQKQLRRRLRKQLLKGDAPAEEEEEGNGDDSDTLKLVDYTGLSDSDSGESVIYEAPITKAAEERPAEEKHVFAVGGAVGGPPSPAEKSVLRTLQWAGKRLQSPKAFKLRQKLWDDDAAVAAAEGRASSETWRHVEEREQLLLLLLCSTKASTFVFVSHSDFLRGLDKLDRLGNAQLRPLLLHCSPKPKVTPL